MKKIAASMFAVYAAGTAPGFAADVVAVPSPQPFVYQEVQVEEAEPQWDGPYLGLRGGYGWTHARGTVSGTGGPFIWNDSLAGAIASAFAGYNMQLENNIVLGAEADVDYNWNESEFQDQGGYREHGTRWGGSLRGRIGYAMGRALVYGTAGLAISDFYLGGGSSPPHQVVYGYTLGAGLDYALTDNIFTRIEYRYSGYPETAFMDDYYGRRGQKTDQSASSNVVTIGVGAKF